MSEVQRKQRQERFEKRFRKINLLFLYFSRISCMSKESPDQFKIYLNSINSSNENIIVTLEVQYRYACDTKCFISDLYKRYDLSKYRKEIDHKNEQFWQSITNIRLIFKNEQICIQYRTKQNGEYKVMKENWYEVRNILIGNSDKEIIFKNVERRTDVIIGVRMRNFKKEIVIAVHNGKEYILYDMKYLMNFESLCELNNKITHDMMRCIDEQMKEMEERLLKIQGDNDNENRIIDMIDDVMKKQESENQVDSKKKRVKVSFTKEYFEMNENENENEEELIEVTKVQEELKKTHEIEIIENEKKEGEDDEDIEISLLSISSDKEISLESEDENKGMSFDSSSEND